MDFITFLEIFLNPEKANDACVAYFSQSIPYDFYMKVIAPFPEALDLICEKQREECLLRLVNYIINTNEECSITDGMRDAILNAKIKLKEINEL